MSDDELSKFLVKAANTYNRRHIYRLAPVLQEQAIQELASFNLLSIRALAAIVECSEYRVHSALRGRKFPEARGKLNPRHISWLGYMLSTKKFDGETLRELIADGTSVSTIADLTNVSEATIHRWRKS